MGCNCNKKRTVDNTPQATARRAAATQPPANQLQQTQQRTSSSSTTGRTQQFSLMTTSGKTLKFGSKLEADAMNVRLGGGGIVKPS